jgi:hypothetical protein
MNLFIQRAAMVASRGPSSSPGTPYLWAVAGIFRRDSTSRGIFEISRFESRDLLVLFLSDDLYSLATMLRCRKEIFI